MNFDFESRLLKVRQETHDTKTFRFEVPDNFIFLPGQFVVLELNADGRRDTRPFSISSSPTKKRFIEITKKIGISEFAKELNEMEENSAVRIRGPYGFFVLDEKNGAILLADGIGVTPFRSYIEYVTDKKLKNKIALFYSNKTPDDVAFMEEFEALIKKNPNIKIISTITRSEESNVNWNGLIGRIDENMIKQHAKADNAIYYVCGPPAMVDAMVAIVKNMNIPRERIKIERFFGY